MRIAFLLGEFPSLSETFILDQVTALIERGHEVSIFAERRSRDPVAHPAVTEHDLLARTRYENLPGSPWQRATQLPPPWRWPVPMWRSLDVRRFGALGASLRLAWGVQLLDGRRDFDVIQCHFGALGLKAVLLRETGALSGAIVTAFHGEDITNYPRQFAPGVYARLFAHGDRFLPISARWNDSLSALGCPMDRVHVHPMGVRTGRFASHARPSREDGRIRILSVSRLVAKKGVGDAIRAVAGMESACQLVIVGEGPLRGALQALAEELGVGQRVTFVGALSGSDVAEQLRIADIFIAPSVTARDGDIEGIPVSIMEAMAAGLPVVSTMHSGIPELVHDGVSGFLVQEGDVAALGAHLTTLAGDETLRFRMGAAGRETVQRNFDVDRLTDQLVGHYEELIAARRPRASRIAASAAP